MTHEETIAKSVALGELLAKPLEGSAMAEKNGNSGTKLVGELGLMLDDVHKMMDSVKGGIAAAVVEFKGEVEGLKHVETHIRGQSKAVRDFKTGLLGNATGGEGVVDEGQQQK